MKQTTLRDTMISALKLEGCSEAERDRIVNESIQTVVEKTISELIDTLPSDEVAALQQWDKCRDIEHASGIRKKFSKNTDPFLIIFNKNINDFIRKFQESSV